MYAKIFAQIYDGTLCTDGPWEALVTFQQLLILADQDGNVDMTLPAISRRTTIPLDILERGIAALLRPDPHSRTPTEDGRRILPLSDGRGWGWRITNYVHYRQLKREEDRRAYHRDYWHTRKRKESTKIQSAARSAVEVKIISGDMKRGPCEVCGTTTHVEAHHDDYSRPLDVRWLCKKHHEEHHHQKELNNSTCAQFAQPNQPIAEAEAKAEASTQSSPVLAPRKRTASTGSRLSADWSLPKGWGEWALSEFPAWGAATVRAEAEKFRDFWVSKSGKDATKLDWQATWRNWCRNAKPSVAAPPAESFRERDLRIAAERVAEATGGLAHDRSAVQSRPLPFERGYVEVIEGQAHEPQRIAC